MIQRPETRYARSGDVMVAYQVTGEEHAVDLVHAIGSVSHLELFWDVPEAAWLIERLSSFSRLIRFDKRGTGMSDRPPGAPTLEERTDDIRAVMDAAESERAFIFGSSEGAHMDVHVFFRGPEAERIAGEIEEFVTGSRPLPDVERSLATVMFTDIVNSTQVAAELGDRGWRDLVERHHRIVRDLLARSRGIEMDTAGDGFLVTFDGPARAVRCALAAVDAVAPLGIEIRAGVHTGEVETIDGKAGGIAVVIGARIAAAAGASEVLVSSTVKDLTAGANLVFEDLGERELKGVPGRWRVYRVAAGVER